VHPDRQQAASEDEGRAAAQQFAQLHRAYEVLSDPESRAKYDRYLAAGLNLSYDTWLGKYVVPTPSLVLLHGQLTPIWRSCACVRSCCVCVCGAMQTCSSISG
jgi:hypothetical protein